MFVEITEEAFRVLRGLEVVIPNDTESTSLVVYQYYDRHGSQLVEAFYIDSQSEVKTHYYIRDAFSKDSKKDHESEINTCDCCDADFFEEDGIVTDEYAQCPNCSFLETTY